MLKYDDLMGCVISFLLICGSLGALSDKSQFTV